MRNQEILEPLSMACLALCMAAAAAGQAASDTLASAATAGDGVAVKAIAEVESRISLNGREVVKLVPAARVVPGDQVIYTLEIRNTRAAAVPGPSVPYPIPDHMRYIADSAVAPGAEVSYSIDGGRTFDRPENLKVVGPDGQPHPASAADYTHIRWQFKHVLKGNAVAFAHFRAIVK